MVGKVIKSFCTTCSDGFLAVRSSEFFLFLKLFFAKNTLVHDLKPKPTEIKSFMVREKLLITVPQFEYH